MADGYAADCKSVNAGSIPTSASEKNEYFIDGLVQALLVIIWPKSFKTIKFIDNLNDYYDVKLKKDRLLNLNKFDNFSFVNADLKILS